MLLILIAFGLAVFGVVRLGRTLETRRQRVVLVVVFILAVVWRLLKLVDLGLLSVVAG